HLFTHAVCRPRRPNSGGPSRDRRAEFYLRLRSHRQRPKRRWFCPTEPLIRQHKLCTAGLGNAACKADLPIVADLERQRPVEFKKTHPTGRRKRCARHPFPRRTKQRKALATPCPNCALCCAPSAPDPDNDPPRP